MTAKNKPICVVLTGAGISAESGGRVIREHQKRIEKQPHFCMNVKYTTTLVQKNIELLSRNLQEESRSKCGCFLRWMLTEIKRHSLGN